MQVHARQAARYTIRDTLAVLLPAAAAAVISAAVLGVTAPLPAAAPGWPLPVTTPAPAPAVTSPPEPVPVPVPEPAGDVPAPPALPQ